MIRRVVLDCGVAETRAVRLEGDDIVEFWFGPAPGDESLKRAPEAGDIFCGRVARTSTGLHGAFIDIGADRDAFLALAEGAAAPVEGERLLVAVRRPPLGRKGALVSRAWGEGLSPEQRAAIEARAAHARGLMNPTSAAMLALRALHVCELDRVEAASLEAAAALPPDATLRDDPDFAETINDARDRALERTVALPGGARLTVDETEGGAVVDVDAGAAAEGHPSAGDLVNAAAANVVFLELSRRAIGGRILVDFIAPKGKQARLTLLRRLAEAPRGGYEYRLGVLSADGLLDLTAPRRRRSLLEQASEPDGARPRPGRRFTLDWQAKAAIRALESKLRRLPKARPTLLAGRELADYLAVERPQWRDRLLQRHGGRFAIEARDHLGRRDFDLVE
jgi:Ribonuclease G/E